jgi:spore coat protein U-like protein
MRRAELLFAAAAAAFWAAPGQACTISASGVDFGAYDPRSTTADDGVGQVNLNCPTGTKTATVTISTGNSGSYTVPRRMTSGTNNLNYNLFTNSNRTTIWGNGSSGTGTMSVSSRGVFTLPIYGRIPAGQNVRAGTYSDTVTVTVTF